ncbi:GNIH protein, partial [Mionectes macconnelli]|nr:GNIH protein [Mionectes macconnelli]
MKVILTKKFILFALATGVFLTSTSMCLSEPMKSSLESREDDDKYYEIQDDILEEKQRSLNYEEMEDPKMNPFTVNKMPNSVANLPLRFGSNYPEERSVKPFANLPLRFGRNYPEERSIKPFANLPLRFGRAFGRNIPNHAPKVPHRLGRSPLARSFSQSLLNLPQRFGKSLTVNQESEPGN